MAIRAVEIEVDRAGAVDIDRDRVLVLRHQRGDDGAFDELYRRYHRRLVTYCQRRVGDHHIAEELAQEAFMRALRAMPAFAGERRFYPWMTVIAQRLCIDHHRRSARVEPAAEVDTGAVEPDHGALWAAVERDHLDAAMEQLAPRHREILRLREHQGWSYQQIATYLDVPMTTVEALLHRARKALRREYLAAAGDDAGRPLGAAAGLAAALAKVKGWVLGVGPERWVPVIGSVAAGVTALGLAVAPLAEPAGSDDGNLRRTPSSSVEIAPAASAGAVGEPSIEAPSIAPATTAAPTAGTTGIPSAGVPEAPAPVATLGPVNVYQGPEAAEYADATNADEPVSVPLGDAANFGIDPAALATYLVDSLLSNPEADAP